MSRFEIVKAASEIELSEKWVNSQDFDAQKIVDRKGKRISADYAGHRYNLIAKKERHFSCLEKFGRRFLGTLVVIATLGIAFLQSKKVKHLFTKHKETRYFGTLIKIKKHIGANPINLNPIKQRKMTIFFKTLVGTTKTFKVYPWETVRQFKNRIVDSGYGIPYDEIFPLVFAGKRLEDDKALSEYNIQTESTIQHVLRLRGD